jgi:dTDP-4-amino-4,6-dideoxygalactose transaminase
LADRKRKYNIYKTELSSNASLSFQKITDDCNFSYFPAVFPDEAACLKVLNSLMENHIFPRRYFYPSINTFTKLVPYTPMPIAEDIASRILCLPLYFTLSETDMERIIHIIKASL